MKSARLSDVALIQRESVHPTQVDPSTIYLGLEHLERGGRIIGYDTVGNAGLASNKYVFSSQHILYGKLRPNLGKISRPTFGGVCSTDILPVLPSAKIDRDYLTHYLSQPSMVDFAASRASGASLPRLSPTTLGAFQIPLPPLDEQRRIAAILDHADELRVKRRQMFLLHSSLGTALYSDMFRAGGAKVSLGSIAVVRGGKRLRKSESYSPGPTRHPYIRVTDLVDGVVDHKNVRYIDEAVHAGISRYIVNADDVIISIAGTIGLVASVPPAFIGANLTENAARIVPRQPETYRSEWLAFALRTPELQAQIRSLIGQVTIGKLALFRIETLELTLPPLDKQDLFLSRLASLREWAAQLREASNIADELFASLQNSMFRGEL
ncbi:restriction endonuclease subunit S [Clavibacter sp. VKM Ac-2872]|uniref:restriction endonuclease subunit S n=1 Tax=Clavibacter sp. VKM Ac-2872 TaxID=2783812 RepID=UPI00188A649B|nr:restriction endonuclease subunit S [Clavibacter sp. VKM Ac-2872]MBF4622737.1 restriction endonuclease subunit S [Clavibacter sp. VKM Ac-2872]